MNKEDYKALAAELEVNVTDENTIPQIKEALCDALIEERGEHEEEVAGLNAAITSADKALEAKAPVITIDKSDYKYIGVKHHFKGEIITAERLSDDSDLAKACLEAGVGFLVEL